MRASKCIVTKYNPDGTVASVGIMQGVADRMTPEQWAQSEEGRAAYDKAVRLALYNTLEQPMYCDDSDIDAHVVRSGSGYKWSIRVL